MTRQDTDMTWTTARRDRRRSALRSAAAIVAVAGLLGATPTAWAGSQQSAERELTLEIADGRVTLVARDVTVAAILAEWARVGQTIFVNGDEVTGPTVTLEMTDVAERDALDVVLRSVSGYMAVPRPEADTGTSVYGRVFVMATSAGAAAARSGLGPSRPRPTPFGRPPSISPVDADTEALPMGGFGPEPPDPNAGVAPGTAPTADTPAADAPPYPTPAGQPLTPLLPGGVMPGAAPTPGNPWGVPAGSSATPGVIVQPEQPAQPGRTP